MLSRLSITDITANLIAGWDALRSQCLKRAGTGLIDVCQDKVELVMTDPENPLTQTSCFKNLGFAETLSNQDEKGLSGRRHDQLKEFSATSATPPTKLRNCLP